MTGRSAASIVVFVIGTLLCAVWGYRSVTAMWPAAVTPPSGGIGAVSSGLLQDGVLLLAVVVSLSLTFWFTAGAESGRLANIWRVAHVAAAIILIGMTVVGGQFPGFMALALFMPTLCFFANGSFVLWLSSRRMSA